MELQLKSTCDINSFFPQIQNTNNEAAVPSPLQTDATAWLQSWMIHSSREYTHFREYTEFFLILLRILVALICLFLTHVANVVMLEFPGYASWEGRKFWCSILCDQSAHALCCWNQDAQSFVQTSIIFGKSFDFFLTGFDCPVTLWWLSEMQRRIWKKQSGAWTHVTLKTWAWSPAQGDCHLHCDWSTCHRVSCSQKSLPASVK